MEYNNPYMDEGEMPQLEDDESSGSGVSLQYIHHENGVSELGPSASTQHHPVVDEEELLAAQEAADAAVAQQQQHGTPGGVFSNVGQGLAGKNRDIMMQYWQETINSIEHDDHDFKNHQLPLARIKKVMKTDEDVRMISAEAPILFAKGCDVFITELTMRAWIHAEENKRRTLQKSDIAAALTKSDMFDFLIDVVPREEEKPKKSYPPRPDNFGSHPGLLLLHMLHGQHTQMPHNRTPNHPQIPTMNQGPLAPGPSHLPQGLHNAQRPASIPLAYAPTELHDRLSAPGQIPNRPQPPSTTNSNQGHVPTVNSLQSPPLGQAARPLGTGENKDHLSGSERTDAVNREHGYSVTVPPQHPPQIHEPEDLKENNPGLGDTAKDVDLAQKAPGPFYDNYSSFENNF